MIEGFWNMWAWFAVSFVSSFIRYSLRWSDCHYIVYNERLFKQLLIQIIFLSFETKWINVIDHDTVYLRYF